MFLLFSLPHACLGICGLYFTFFFHFRVFLLQFTAGLSWESMYQDPKEQLPLLLEIQNLCLKVLCTFIGVFVLFCPNSVLFCPKIVPFQPQKFQKPVCTFRTVSVRFCTFLYLSAQNLVLSCSDPALRYQRLMSDGPHGNAASVKKLVHKLEAGPVKDFMCVWYIHRGKGEGDNK